MRKAVCWVRDKDNTGKKLPRTMKLWMGSLAGWFFGLCGHVLTAAVGHVMIGCAVSAVSVQPSFGSLQPPSKGCSSESQ